MSWLKNLFNKEEPKPTGPICARCRKPLEKVDMSGRGVIAFGAVPTLYNGVVCTNCGKIECSPCKGRPFDKPCSWCGGKVSPAYENLLTSTTQSAA